MKKSILIIKGKKIIEVDPILIAVDINVVVFCFRKN